MELETCVQMAVKEGRPSTTVVSQIYGHFGSHKKIDHKLNRPEV